MIKVRVTSPFRYQFLNGDNKLVKDHFFAAGDYYHIDPNKEKLEAKFVLSPTFAFKNYIHVDVETVPLDLAKEVGMEAGFYSEPTMDYVEEHIPTLIDMSGKFETGDDGELLEPIHDASPNKFDLTSDPNVKVKDEEVEDEVIIEEKSFVEKHQGALNTPDIEPVVYPHEDEEPTEVVIGGQGEQDKREKELTSLNYKKVQEITELYNIKYTNKRESIKQILAYEFGDDETTPTDIPV